MNVLAIIIIHVLELLTLVMLRIHVNNARKKELEKLKQADNDIDLIITINNVIYDYLPKSEIRKMYHKNKEIIECMNDIYYEETIIHKVKDYTKKVGTNMDNIDMNELKLFNLLSKYYFNDYDYATSNYIKDYLKNYPDIYNKFIEKIYSKMI